MINADLCKFEETFDSPFDRCKVHFFTYPTEEAQKEVIISLGDYGNVISACISVAEYDLEERYEVRMSPTISMNDGNTVCDVDWIDLFEGFNYTKETVDKLIRKANTEVWPL